VHQVGNQYTCILSAMFSNTLSLCSSPTSTDQISRPFKTIGVIIVLPYIINP